jgi:pyruvate/oxaloacetate carboxyltransferase
MKTAMAAVKKYGGICEAAISYTTGPIHTIEYFVNLAKETPMIDKLQDAELDEIFFALAGQWAFEVNEE